MILKDLILIVWKISPSAPHYRVRIYPLLDSWEMKIWIIHVSRDAQASGHLFVPFILNKHIHPFGISNPKYLCCMNFVIQLLFSILRTISHNFQFNSSTESSLSKFLFETAHSAPSSTDVDALKFRLVQFDKFDDGQNQEDASECLMMLIEFVNKGWVAYFGSNDNNSTGISLPEAYFHLC